MKNILSINFKKIVSYFCFLIITRFKNLLYLRS